jgi:outer membrane protein assembly factor BamB
MRRSRPLLIIAVLAVAVGAAAGESAPAKKPPADAFQRTYAGYRPSFLDVIPGRRMLAANANMMKLSREKSFFSLTILDEYDRATAIVEAGLRREAKGETREAMKLYQLAIERHPRTLRRVSAAGVFVTVGQYCQRRILQLPAADLAFYRTMYDGRAREAFAQARRGYSLAGFQDIVDTMLATSYGDNALAALGDAALDTADYEEALQRYGTVRALFARSDSDTPALAMKIALCLKKLGRPAAKQDGARTGGDLSAADLARLKKAVADADADGVPPDQQRACPPYLSASDYVRFEPPADGMALREPTWSVPLPGARGDHYVFTQPVIAGNSVLYRHKNIVYCRSVLNGELRWTFDVGGRVSWQSHGARKYPLEELVVMDGMVYTNVFKVGPSLVALDLTTGQLRWASGRMAPATREDMRMRYEAAPAIGARTIYAGYVKDNIEGDTHIDSAYGLRAFDAATGRVLWDTEVCRLAPGKFTTGVAVTRRNRIRSFTSPPVLHQGVLYYNTNAGAITAVNARSGRIEWTMLYPYWPAVHDAARRFGSPRWWLSGPHRLLRPAGWLNQRPLVLGDSVIVGPVDSPCLMSIDRATGKVAWTYARGGGDHAYMLGPTGTGELVLAFSGRAGSIQLLDPKTGKITWRSPDPIKPESSPALTASSKDIMFAVNIQNSHNHPFWLGARPFLTRDDRLYVASFDYVSPNMAPGGWVYNLASFSLKDRQLLHQRRYYDVGVRARVKKLIREEAPKRLAGAKPGPKRDLMQAIADAEVPGNAHGPFRPFSRMTFARHGTRFELRAGTQTLAMCYDRSAVAKSLKAAAGPRADFARAELALAESRFTDAATLLGRCLAAASADDLDFRAAVNQQLHRVQLSISQTAIRQARPADEVTSAQELYRRSSTAGQEVQALLALSEAYERNGAPANAARCLQSVVRRYARRPHRVPALAWQDPARIAKAASVALDAAAGKVHREFFAEPAARGIELLRAGLPLYFSTVSPLPRTLTVEAESLAAQRLLALVGRYPKLAAALQERARTVLAKAEPEERLQLVRQFPGTPAARQALAGLFVGASKATGLARRRQLWQLGEIAAMTGAPLPQAHRAETLFGAGPRARRALSLPMKDRAVSFEDPSGGLRMVLTRRGDLAARPELVFVGGRAKKRLDNKFEVACVDARTGRKLWVTPNIRLRGKGQEPGFTEAFVRGPLVVVHGFYDVLALSLADGKVQWRYAAPFDFEITHATAAGDLLVLSGASHTIALYVPAKSAAGEVVWTAPETGEPYTAPYARGERLISVRHLPSGVTARRIGTGRMLGRLELPDLSRFARHPLIEGGPKALPVARSGDRLFVTDGWYYIAVDTARMRVAWKRLIEANDRTREPPMRLTAGKGVLLALKQDYQTPAMVALDAATGRRLWRTDRDNAAVAKPMYSAVISGGRIYGLIPGTGRSFGVCAVDAATGKALAKWSARETYQSKPAVELFRNAFGGSVVVRVQDRQTFELIALDGKTCRPLHTITCKGVGPWNIAGRVSATVQAGGMMLMNATRLVISGK